MQNRVLENPKIQLVWNTQVVDVLGDDLLFEMVCESTLDHSVTKLEVAGLCYAIRHVAQFTIPEKF